MRLSLICLFLFTSSGIFGQCKDENLVKPWGKWNQLQFNSTVYRLEHRNSDSLLPANIRQIVKTTLTERCGEKFYSKLSLSDLSIVIPLGKKQNKDDLTAEGVKKGEIKYYYSYVFSEAPNIIYRFNIALDVQGKILTDWSVPAMKDEQYTKFISFCEAADIVYNDKQAEVKTINDVVLMYDPRLNTLGWKITLGCKAHADSHYKTYRITVNAFTGKIIDRWDADLIKYDNPGNR